MRDLGLQSSRVKRGTEDRPLDRSTTPFLSEEWFFLEKMLSVSSLFKSLVMSFPVKGVKTKIDSARRFRRDLGGSGLLRRKRRLGVLPKSLEAEGRVSKGPRAFLRQAFSECEIWAYKVPE